MKKFWEYGIGNVSKIQQLNQRAEKSTKPKLGLRQSWLQQPYKTRFRINFKIVATMHMSTFWKHSFFVLKNNLRTYMYIHWTWIYLPIPQSIADRTKVSLINKLSLTMKHNNDLYTLIPEKKSDKNISNLVLTQSLSGRYHKRSKWMLSDTDFTF